MKIEEAITYAIMSDGHGKTTDPEVSPMKRGNRLPPEGAILGRSRSFRLTEGRSAAQVYAVICRYPSIVLATRARSASRCTKEEGRIRVML